MFEMKTHSRFLKLCALVIYCSLCAAANAAELFDQSHQKWTAVLASSVKWNSAGSASSVDYASLKANHTQLDQYTTTLSQVSEAQFNGFNKLQRRAFLINAYNAFTLQLVLTKYPDLTSIKELGSVFSSPWKKAFVPLLGQTRSLDDIEQTLLRGAAEFDDPRIHFAVNCASIGCPALRPEAFVAARLDAQLLDQTQRFLRDRSRNRYNKAGQILELSMIFKWYSGDFERGFLGAKNVAEFVSSYAGSIGLTPAQLAQLKSGDIDIDYTDYSWKLNKR
jgi:hypothetical protein